MNAQSKGIVPPEMQTSIVMHRFRCLGLTLQSAAVKPFEVPSCLPLRLCNASTNDFICLMCLFEHTYCYMTEPGPVSCSLPGVFVISCSLIGSLLLSWFKL